MKIIFYLPAKNLERWLSDIAAALPDADVWLWTPENAERQADYAIVWSPPDELFSSQRQLKAVFNLGAGVDRMLALPNLPKGIPLVRLNDAGMAVQMAEYVCHALIRHTREFDVYAAQKNDHQWKKHRPINREEFPVGVMGLGFIGAQVAEVVSIFGYPTFGWSLSPKSLRGVTTFSGYDRLDDFLYSVRVLVCCLPLTPRTEGIINSATLSKLKPNGYLINVGRVDIWWKRICWCCWTMAHLPGPRLMWCVKNLYPNITLSGHIQKSHSHRISRRLYCGKKVWHRSRKRYWR